MRPIDEARSELSELGAESSESFHLWNNNLLEMIVYLSLFGICHRSAHVDGADLVGVHMWI